MAVIKTIKSFLGQKIYPQTVMKAVYDENKNRLDNVLNQGVYLDENDEPISGDIQKVDADKLNGQPPTYYAKSADLTQKLDFLDLGSADSAEAIFNVFNSNKSNYKLYVWYSFQAIVNSNYSLVFAYRYSSSGYIGYLFQGGSLYYNNFYSNTNHLQKMV